MIAIHPHGWGVWNRYKKAKTAARELKFAAAKETPLTLKEEKKKNRKKQKNPADDESTNYNDLPPLKDKIPELEDELTSELEGRTNVDNIPALSPFPEPSEVTTEETNMNFVYYYLVLSTLNSKK